MAKKTFSDFIKNYSRNPELHKKVLRAGGVSFEQFKEYPGDYYVANTGAVPGMVYYADTTKFAKRNIWLILEALFEYENEIGQPLDKPTDDLEQFQNWLAWFAWESMAGDLTNYLEAE